MIRVRIAAATLVLQFTFGLVFTWGAVVPYVRREGWPDPLIGLVFSATPLGYGIAAVLGGRLADRFPPRRLCWLAFGLLATGFLVAFLVPGPLTFVLFYSFLGLGLGGGIAITGSLAAAVYAFPRWHGGAGGVLTGVYALGAVVQLPVVAQLAAAEGWVWALREAGGGLALLSLLALLLMPPIPARRMAEDEPLVRVGIMLRRRRLVLGMLVVAALSPLGTYALVNGGVFARAAGLGSVAAVSALVAMAFGNASGRVAAGVLADRFGVDPILFGLVLCLLLAGPLVVAGATAGLVVVLVAGCLAAGLVLGGAAGVMARAGADAAPDAPHSAFGLMFGGYAFGALAGPLIGPLLGQGRVPWIGLSGLGIVAGGLAALRARSGAGGPRVLSQEHEDDRQRGAEATET